MEIDELKRQINIGNVPVTVFTRRYNQIININIKLTKDYTVFYDYDNIEEYDTEEGGVRITFVFDSFDKMIESVNDYINSNDRSENDFADNDIPITMEEAWLQVKNDFFSHKIKLLKDSREWYIGEVYWRGLYLNEISPLSSIDDIVCWFEKRRIKQHSDGSSADMSITQDKREQ